MRQFKVEKIQIIHVRLPLKEPFSISSGTLIAKDTIIVKLHHDGLIGYGEAPCECSPHYSHETTQTGLHIIRDFIVPAIRGQSFQSVEHLIERMSFIRGHFMARAGVEMAAWDLVARMENIPMYQVFGGERKPIATGVSIGLKPTLPDLLNAIEGFLKEGYQRIKIKVTPGTEIKAVGAIRKEFGEIALMVDANSAYTLNDIPIFQELDHFGLTMIEQPLAYDDIIDHAVLQRAVKTPICLDESIHHVDDARKALQLGSCRIINIKLSRVGGLLETRKIHDLCRLNNVPVWCGSMLESGIGEAHNMALATLPNFIIPGDIAPAFRYFSSEIIDPLLTMHKDGTMELPKGSGIGVSINESALRKVQIASFEG